MQRDRLVAGCWLTGSALILVSGLLTQSWLVVFAALAFALGTIFSIDGD